MKNVAITVVTLMLLPALGSPAMAQLDSAAWSTDWDNHVVPVDSLFFFGPRDGIPELNNPAFVSAGTAAQWLDDREPVAVVSHNGVTKGYPVQILMHHDVVNDVVGGRPVVVTFCILCGSALAFDRRLDGQVLEFGVAGALYNSNLVMYDRQTHTWWGQAVGEGLIGEHAGQRLTLVPAPLLSFRDFRDNYPDAVVLSRDTGYDRDYGTNRMADYEDRGPFERIFQKETDVRLPAKERVVTLEAGDAVVAIPFRALSNRRVIEVEIGDSSYVVLWGPGTASIYSQRTADGRDVGAAVAYSPVVNGRTLDLEPAGEGYFRDEQTGSLWNLSGRAVEGPLRGEELRVAEHGIHFWFAWAAYRPETRVIER